MAPSSYYDILKIIKSLKNTNSVGHDGITTKVIKYVADSISHHLSYILNLCISAGIYPKHLKRAIIKPLKKNVNNQYLESFRPIALVPVLSKVYEKYIYEQVYKYLEKYEILTDNQKGFRKGKTINMAIYDFLNEVIVNVDKRNPVCAVYCDMTQAFDYVDHDILLNKLNKYGVRGNVLQLIESYLKDRKQCVQITKFNCETKQEHIYRSKQRTVSYGVPQGSVLGPLLFIIYINDLPKITTNSMTLFADDSTVTISCSSNENFEAKINSTISSIITWLYNNNLRINLDKTKIMFFSQRLAVNNDFNICFNNNAIEQVCTSKFLGLLIDRKLDWKAHLESLSTRMNKAAYMLHKIAPILGVDARLTAYHGIVGSILRYGVIFWGNSTNKEIIFRSQKRCVRAMFGLKPSDTCQPYFIKHKILTLPSLYIFEVAVFVKSNPQLFKKMSDYSTRNRRDNDRLCVRMSNTSLMHKSVYCMAPLIYNKLPRPLKNVTSFNTFKDKLKKYLIEKCYYNLTDYITELI